MRSGGSILAGTNMLEHYETWSISLLSLADRTRAFSIRKQEPTCNERNATDWCDGTEQLSDWVLRLGKAKTVDGAAEESDTGSESVAGCHDRAGLGQAECIEEGQAVQELVLGRRVPCSQF